MGVVSDQEIVQMVGTEDNIMTMFSASLGTVLKTTQMLRIFSI